MSTLSKGTLFHPELVKDLFSKVQGKSSLAKLAGSMPVAFNGNDVMVFSMDSEIDIVAENAAKSHGGVTLTPVTIAPIKVEYGARVSDEFMYASEEKQLDILKAFNDGFAVKVARGLDIMAMHGLNPRSKQASLVIGNNHLDHGSQTVTYDSSTPDANIEAAVALIGDYDVTGIAMAKPFAQALAALTANGQKLYPELAWGGSPASINGIPVDVNSTVNFYAGLDRAIVGDFANCFKWGYAKEIPLEVIPYGDPDNTGSDLKGHNQVYLRCEAYLGWGILDENAFARIVSTTSL